MLDAVAGMPRFAERFAVVCDALGCDPRRDLEGRIDSNRTSSLLTALVSRLMLDQIAAPPRAVAGHSVGQWMAMHAAGMLSFESLVRILVERCRSMDACARRRPGGMIAVLGLREEVVRAACAECPGAQIASYNCVGQYSVAAPEGEVGPLMNLLARHKPKRLVRLPVAGPWHSTLLADAEAEFASFLTGLRLEAPVIPVVDNTTGGLLPDDPRVNLARHLSHPVRWEDGVRTLVRLGCRELVEVGFGDVLTRFGFFIDRSVIHRATCAPAR
jgi:[acyl-carrier-protein] S-malonyltransferase